MSLEELNAPEWTMSDAYIDIGSERYESSILRAKASIEKIKSLEKNEEIAYEMIQPALTQFDRATTLLSSLQSFVKCTGAKDSTDERVAVENGRLSDLVSELSRVSQTLFKKINSLSEDDPIWNTSPLADWRFFIKEQKRSWTQKLSDSDRNWLADFESKVFSPLGEVFKTLQKKVDFEAMNSQGEIERIKAAKLVSIVKGHPDRELRKNVFKGLNQSYEKNADLYAALLNNMHGFRLVAFKRAEVEPLEVSLAQNRMSIGALFALREAIQSKIDVIRQAVTLRAPYFKEANSTKLQVFDLMAPAPDSKDISHKVPYPEGIEIVKSALNSISSEMSDFVDLMLEKSWIDAKASDKKIGGAFYSRFNEFRIPRVFSSYIGNITSIIQQGHELGHAFHYWNIRDLPVVQTEFPMTLTEMASTFNEALIRRYLIGNSQDNGFAMLWQELRSAANFLLNTMVRMDFELEFLNERQKGIVRSSRCVELMREAWRKWYGDTTIGADDYLWAYKLHYYKTDQFIYNYPYAVGYLLSEGLLAELDNRGSQFMSFYKALLRDTGRATVDEIIKCHYKARANDPEFWLKCMNEPLKAIETFSQRFAKSKA